MDPNALRLEWCPKYEIAIKGMFFSKYIVPMNIFDVYWCKWWLNSSIDTDEKTISPLSETSHKKTTFLVYNCIDCKYFTGTNEWSILTGELKLGPWKTLPALNISSFISSRHDYVFGSATVYKDRFRLQIKGMQVNRTGINYNTWMQEMMKTTATVNNMNTVMTNH